MTAVPDGLWELAGDVRVVRNTAGWTLLGGDEDDGGVTLRLLIHHPTDDELVRRVALRVPFAVDGDGQLDVGATRPLE